MSRSIRLLFDSFAEDPLLDTAISRAILLGVDDGSEPETMRIHRPGNVVAFGRQDSVSPGYRAAVSAARLHGFEPVERLAGGRAAIFHDQTIAFAWAIPDRAPKEGITDRFVEICGIIVTALKAIGVDAAIGEVPGEYCPGRYSVHARGERKLVGTGQRLTRRAAHVGGVIVVDGRQRVNDILTPIYRALDVGWRADATGDVRSEVPSASWEGVRGALVAAFRERYTLERGTLGDTTLNRAADLAPEHRPRVA
ncbi:MAG: lipoate--protein ligase family protein [Acidimicrobiia bacterium]|nr:lipoate--protein ligase family protein [Acidimicrobiia bacterium]